jgi:manganese oxidase
MKIRANQAHGDYRDPGWYQAPAGSVAYPWQGEPPPTLRDAAP